MNIAGLRVRVTIQKNTTAVDRIGNHTSVWTDFFSCLATYIEIIPLRADGYETNFYKKD